MTLIDGAVGRQKIKVFLTLHIPHMYSEAFAQDNGDGMVIMGTVFRF
jgi:hypothetical protein